MERRGFFAVTITGIAAAFLPKLPVKVNKPSDFYTIKGDGIHDDTPGIQAELDRAGYVELGPGTFRLGTPLRVGPHHHVIGVGRGRTIISGSMIVNKPNIPGFRCLDLR